MNVVPHQAWRGGLDKLWDFDKSPHQLLLFFPHQLSVWMFARQMKPKRLLWPGLKESPSLLEPTRMSISRLSSFEYLGRMILLGRDPSGEYDVLAYAVTGRSPSSRARRLVMMDDGSLRTDVTQPEQLQQGNPKLLLYDCIRRCHDQWLVSNGMQTDLLYEAAVEERRKSRAVSPVSVLARAFHQPHWVEGHKPHSFIDLTMYEPDAPTYTPRISGVIGSRGAALTIAKRVHDQTVRSWFEVPLTAGHGCMISTYSGQNVPSGEAIPSFSGEPLALLMEQETPEQLAQDIHTALGPKEGPTFVSPGADFRVGVAVYYIHRESRTVSSSILNQSA